MKRKKQIQDEFVGAILNNVNYSLEWDNTKYTIDDFQDEYGHEGKRSEFYDEYLDDCEGYNNLHKVVDKLHLIISNKELMETINNLK